MEIGVTYWSTIAAKCIAKLIIVHVHTNYLPFARDMAGRGCWEYSVTSDWTVAKKKKKREKETKSDSIFDNVILLSTHNHIFVTEQEKEKKKKKNMCKYLK